MQPFLKMNVNPFELAKFQLLGFPEFFQQFADISMFAMLSPELCLKDGKSPSSTSFYFRDLRTFKKTITMKRRDEFFS